MSPHSASRQHEAGFITGFSLLLPITLSTMAIVLLAPILPKLLEEFSHVPGYEYWVPMVLTVPALCVALFSPLAGMLGDYFGRRRLLIGSFVVYAIVGIMPVFLQDLTAILISRIGVGIAEAFIMVMTTTMIGDYFTAEKRDKWLSAQTAFASVSALLFFNIGGQLGQFGWRTPFWVYGSALLMMVLVILFTWEPSSDAHPDEEADQAPHNSSWEGFPWARMLTIIAITVYGSIFFYTVQIQAPVGLDALGWKNPAQTGFWTSVASIGVPLGTLIFSQIASTPIKRLLICEFAILTVGFSIMGYSHSPALFLVGCFINQIGAGMLLPSLVTWAMSILPFAVRSRGAGMWTGAFTAGQFLCPLVVTYFSQQFGGLFSAFSALAVGAAIGVGIALIGKYRRGIEGVSGAATHG
ncbi:MAG: MFS transporter [Sphingomonadaceae bacterium]